MVINKIAMARTIAIMMNNNGVERRKYAGLTIKLSKTQLYSSHNSSNVFCRSKAFFPPLKISKQEPDWFAIWRVVMKNILL